MTPQLPATQVHLVLARLAGLLPEDPDVILSQGELKTAALQSMPSWVTESGQTVLGYHLN